MKLSTSDLQTLISGYISTKEAREIFDDFYQEDPSELWELWCDAENWKCVQSELLGDDAGDYFSNGPEAYFDIDVLGWSDQMLIQKCFNDAEFAKQCFKYEFIPHDEFADNFRLEIFLTPEKDKVIGWSLSTD